VVLDVSVFPLMWMLWAGGLIIVAGGTWSFAASRGRRSRAKSDMVVSTDTTGRELAAAASAPEEQEDD
jgi:hypothetical protein